VRPPGALVLGGDYRALGIVRSLGRRGIEVWVLHGDDRIACTSRYARKRIRRASGSEAQQVGQLLRLAENAELDGWVLFPTAEETAWSVSRHHEVLGSYFRLTTSPWERYEVAADKRLAFHCARTLDVDVPRTWFPSSRDEVADLDVEFPVILKPAVRLEFNPLTHDKAWRVDDRNTLLERYDQAVALVDPQDLMIQELIPGGGDCQLSFAAACRDGVPIASITARRTRQYPHDFGRASTFVETVDRPDVLKASLRLLDDLRLDGLVEIEFKQDPRDGQLKLLDVNARAWGWHSVGEAAGVDFAYAAWRVAMGHHVPQAHGRPGVRWARMSMDVPASLRDIAAKRLRVRTYLSSLRRPLSGPIAALDDPMPMFFDLPLMGLRGVKRSVRGAVGRARGASARRPVVARRARGTAAT
jgi:predicted ATP-grasp superfamily ATP-dependent carboligase